VLGERTIKCFAASASASTVQRSPVPFAQPQAYRFGSADQEALVLVSATERPAPRIIACLEHEYSLRDQLDSDWAVRPLALTRREVGQSSLGREASPDGGFPGCLAHDGTTQK
jgi:hypothetical protein